MAHPAVELAGLLVTFLNAGARPWTGNWTAKYKAVPTIRHNSADEPEVISTRRINVYPVSWTGELASRAGTTDDDVIVSIGFMQTLPAGTAYDSDAADTWINAQLAEIAAVSIECQTKAVTLGNYAAGQFVHAVMADAGRLQRHNLFISVIQASFKKL